MPTTHLKTLKIGFPSIQGIMIFFSKFFTLNSIQINKCHVTLSEKKRENREELKSQKCRATQLPRERRPLGDEIYS